MKHYIVEFDRNYKGLRLVGIIGDMGYSCGYVGVISEWFLDILLLARTSLDKQPQLLVLPLTIAEPIIFFC